MASKKKLSIGDSAVVMDPMGTGDSILRVLPDKRAQKIGQASPGTIVKILDGACEQGNGWVWWIVRIVDRDGKLCNDRVGWMNEWSGDQLHDEYNLVKV